jgi:FkbM family methyltransferase
MLNPVTSNHRLDTPQGEILIPDDQLAASTLAAWRPDWKTEIIGKILALRPGTFVDVGANCGQTLIDYLAAERKESYIGFEPNPYCVRVLESIVAANHRSDCVIVPVGLSDRNEIRKLLLEKGSETDTSASIDAGLRPGREWDVKLVPCYRFDDVSPQVGIDKISLAKIDVEGAELLALRGMEAALQERRHWILCEVLHRDINVGEADHQSRIDGVASFISGIDYICFNIIKSPDDRHASGLIKMAEFPNKVWTWSNASECDYIFVPRQDEDIVSSLFSR